MQSRFHDFLYQLVSVFDGIYEKSKKKSKRSFVSHVVAHHFLVYRLEHLSHSQSG